MHFRQRDNVIQVIRTTYDGETKKAKNLVVGRLSRVNPVVNDKLQDACSPEELQEVETWIAEQGTVDGLKNELAAKTLAEQINRAGLWFDAVQDGDAGRKLAAEAQFAWMDLRSKLRKLDLLD